MTLNCGIQKGTAPLVVLTEGVAVGVVEPDDHVMPDDALAMLDDEIVVPDITELEPDVAEGNEVPPGEDDELPLLSDGETREPVLLVVGNSGKPVLIVNFGVALELTLLGVAGKEVVVLGIDNERLVSVLVVCTGVLGDTELREGVDALAEPSVEVNRVDNDVITEDIVVLPRLEEPGVWVGVLDGLGSPSDIDVESLQDEMLAEETVDVTTLEELVVPGTAVELKILLLTVVDIVWLSVVDVNDTVEDLLVVSVTESLLVPDSDADCEPLTLLVGVDEATWLSVSDCVETEVPDENEDVHEDTETLGPTSVLVVEATGSDEDLSVVRAEDTVEPLLIEAPVLEEILPDSE